MKKKLLIAGKILISVGLLSLLIYRLDGEEISDALLAIDISTFVAAIAVYLAIFIVAAARWNLIGKLTGASLSGWQTLRLLLAAMFFNQVLPTSIGGDAVRAWLASRQGIGLSQSASTVILDRVAGLITLFVVMAIATPFIAPRLPEQVAYWVSLAPLFALGSVAVGLALAGRIADLIDRWSWAEPLVRLLRESRALWSGREKSVFIFLLSLAIHGLNGFSLWILARGIGVELSYLEIMAFLPPVILLMTIPVSIAGWGVREGTVVALFGLIGGPTSLGLVASILWGLAAAAAAIIAGGVWLVTKSPDETIAPEAFSPQD